MTNLLFCVCPKCENKITQYKVLTEYPKGVFTFGMKCDLCNNEFNHQVISGKKIAEMQMDNLNIMIKNIDPENMEKFKKKFLGGGEVES